MIENEKLYEHVSDVSQHLLAELNKLKGKHYIIGDVRGYGYFIGIDFVKSRETREPAIEHARVILERYLNIRIFIIEILILELYFKNEKSKYSFKSRWSIFKCNENETTIDI